MVSTVEEALQLRESGVGQCCMGEVGGRAPRDFDIPATGYLSNALGTEYGVVSVVPSISKKNFDLGHVSRIFRANDQTCIYAIPQHDLELPPRPLSWRYVSIPN
jgi:hypothetical protein